MRHVLAPVAVTAVPAVLMLLLSKDEYRKSFVSATGIDPTAFAGIFWLSAAVVAYPILLRAFWAWVEKRAKPERQLDLEDTLLLLSAIRTVIGEKLERFTLQARSARAGLSSGEVFTQITQPRQQIRLLTKALHALFSAIDSSTSFRVGLLAVRDGRPSEWVCYFPEGRVARTGAQQLAAPTSTVMRSIKAKKTVVVEDVQKELSKTSKGNRNFVKGSWGDDEPGSQLCYPIVDTANHEVVYVLAVAGGKAKSLKSSQLAIYDWLIEQIATRIQLEHCLVELKEGCSVVREAA